MSATWSTTYKRRSRPRASVMSPTTVMAALWLVWLAGWWLGALKSARTVARESPGSQLSYSIFTWIGAALLFFNAVRGGIFSLALFPPLRVVAWTGVALVALGLAYAVWARLRLGKLWSARVTLKTEHRIIKTGPYA